MSNPLTRTEALSRQVDFEKRMRAAGPELDAILTRHKLALGIRWSETGPAIRLLDTKNYEEKAEVEENGNDKEETPVAKPKAKRSK